MTVDQKEGVSEQEHDKKHQKAGVLLVEPLRYSLSVGPVYILGKLT